MKETGLNRKQLGALGEERAAQYLEGLGYRIRERNWRCRTGEIDIIAESGPLLIFVEVRTRSGNRAFGTPQESVDYRKQQQVAGTAQVYIHRCQLQELQPRFDVISVMTDKAGGSISIEHIENAF